MFNEDKYNSKSLFMLLLIPILSVSLIPIIILWGKSPLTNNVEYGDQTINLDIFLDEGCTSKVTSFFWGEITPGGSSSMVVYIKNRSNLPVILSCCISDPSPSDATEYLVLNWDREGYLLEEHKTVKAILTLSVSRWAKFDNFSVNVIISGKV